MHTKSWAYLRKFQHFSKFLPLISKDPEVWFPTCATTSCISKHLDVS